MDISTRCEAIKWMQEQYPGHWARSVVPVDFELRPWQQEAVDRLNHQKAGQVLFVVDKTPKGNRIGKTTLANYLVLKRHNCPMLLKVMQKALFKKTWLDEDMVIFDLTNTKQRINYPLLGWLKSCKSDPRLMCYIDSPVKIIVFTQTDPTKWCPYYNFLQDVLYVN